MIPIQYKPPQSIIPPAADYFPRTVEQMVSSSRKKCPNLFWDTLVVFIVEFAISFVGKSLWMMKMMLQRRRDFDLSFRSKNFYLDFLIQEISVVNRN